MLDERPKARARPMQLLRRRAAAVVLLLVVLALLLLVGFRWARAGALPGVEVDGVTLGGLEQGELDERLEEIARQREAERIEVVRAPVGESGAATRSYPRRELGYSFDAETTRDRVWERGRQMNPVAALADHIRASFGIVPVAPEDSIDERELERWAEEVAESVEVTPENGDLRFDEGSVRAVMPRAGAIVEREDLVRLARTVALRSGPQVLDVPIRGVEPEMTDAAVRVAAAEARAILSAAVVIERGDREVRLTPRDLARVLRAEPLEAEQGAELVVSVVRKRLREVAGERLASLERAPRDAGFTLSSGSVEVVPGAPGFELDHGRLARRLLVIAGSDDRRGRAPGRRKEPDFTTREARELGIDEQVSTFTTEHLCCQPRVDNIHRIADMIDGTVVKPGEAFSVNDAVGERTRGKGFVPAPAIYQGEYVDEVGGGISQFATTMYNAIFFGGYEFLDYKAHSYYISRYPAGREATLSWPSVDLEFRNDSDAGIYIDTSYTDTSITVTFYGSVDVEVEATAGDPHNYKEPPTECKEDPSLSKGERRVVQEGKDGFDIVVYRAFGGSSRDRERFFTRYLPEPRIVERRSCP